PVPPICHTWRRLFLCGVLRVDLRRTMLGREPEPPVPPLIRIERRPAEAGTGRIPSLARLPVSWYQVCAVPVCSGANAPRRGRRRAAFRSTAHVPRGSSVYSRGAEHMGRRHLPARGAIRQGSRASAPRLPRWYGPERDAPQRVRQRSALPAAHRTTLGPAYPLRPQWAFRILASAIGEWRPPWHLVAFVVGCATQPRPRGQPPPCLRSGGGGGRSGALGRLE